MSKDDMLWVEANMFPWKGKHWVDTTEKKRYMAYADATFVWDADAEVWVYERTDGGK